MQNVLFSFLELLVAVLLVALLYWGFNKIAAAFGAPAPVIVVIQVFFTILMCILLGGWLLSLIGVTAWFPVAVHNGH
jgi:hypothetical protein